MTLAQIIQISLGSGGVIGIFYLIFKMGKIVQKIETLDKKTDLISNEIKEIRKDISVTDHRISRMEGYLMYTPVYKSTR